MNGLTSPTCSPNLVDLPTFLRARCEGQACYYYPNPGNGGDSLIAVATYQIFDSQGLRYETINTNEIFDARGKTVLYAGGGNLVRRGMQARTFIERHHKHAKALIVLPHTIDSHEDLLADLGGNVTIIAREPRSFEFLKRHAPNIQLFLAEDVALSLDIESLYMHTPMTVIESVLAKIRRRKSTGDLASKPARFAKRLYARTVTFGKNFGSGRSGILNAFRADVEGRNFEKPRGNIDVSRVFSYGTHSRSSVFTSAYDFLRFLDNYSTINTDRLHVCIGAALLGKKVNFYANDYYKCEEVYRHSLTPFTNVIWHGAAIPR